MKRHLRDYINYRIEKSKRKPLMMQKILAENKSWNACVNRLYYSCFYMVSALLLDNKLNAQTHAGVKSQFSLHFVKTGKVAKELGKLYVDLMDWRHKGDYGDMFDFDQKTVVPIIEMVGKFTTVVERLINES